MSLTLAIEASSATYAVALGTGAMPDVCQERRRYDPDFHSVGEMVSAAVTSVDRTFADIGVIAVDAGPGNLTSVRSAVAYANGLAYSLGVVVFPATSLELMAMESQNEASSAVLCLRKAEGGNAYAGLFQLGEPAELRYGQLADVVTSLAGGLAELLVAGAYRNAVQALLPGTAVRASSIEQPSVLTLYRVVKEQGEVGGRLVPAASPVTEASKVFHGQPAIHHPRG